MIITVEGPCWCGERVVVQCSLATRVRTFFHGRSEAVVTFTEVELAGSPLVPLPPPHTLRLPLVLREWLDRVHTYEVRE